MGAGPAETHEPQQWALKLLGHDQGYEGAQHKHNRLPLSSFLGPLFDLFDFLFTGKEMPQRDIPA